MQRLTRLFNELDEGSRAGDKLKALARYFSEAPARDAAWALYLLAGHRVRKSITAPQLREWAAGASGIPEWLIDAAQGVAGDLAETLALIMPDPTGAQPAPALHALIEERLLPLQELDEPRRREVVLQAWRELGATGRLIWNQLLGGEFRAPVERTLLIRALAALAGAAPAEMAHRLLAPWQPTEAGFRHLIAGDHSLSSPGLPYPFLLAGALEEPPAALGAREEWQAEWHWDGVRAQLIRRRGQVLLWSRGEELLTDRFPEIARAAGALPEGTVMDGVILAWSEQGPRPRGELQRRLGRQQLTRKILEETPAVFMAFDLLERDGFDLRGEPLLRRRAGLEAMMAGAGAGRTPDGARAIRLSEVVEGATWAEVERCRAESRRRGARGLLLKRGGAPYGTGRAGGDWLKWKCEPLTTRAVLLYAQRDATRGGGQGAGYTFGVWSRGLLVPVARTHEGLSDEERGEVEAFVKANTTERFGPVRVVRQELVFELAFEGVQASPRHKAGLILREPRIMRWQRDRLPGQADSIEALRALLADKAQATKDEHFPNIR